jgi:hypothetical protein
MQEQKDLVVWDRGQSSGEEGEQGLGCEYGFFELILDFWESALSYSSAFCSTLKKGRETTH